MSDRFTLNQEQTKKFFTNILFFTAPALAVFFSLLATGVEFDKAYPAFLLVVWGLFADYFKKLKTSQDE